MTSSTKTWTNTWITPVALLAALLGASSEALAFDVRTGHDPGFDLAAIESYRWVEGKPADIPALQQRIEGAVRAQLEAKGLREESEAPDVWVVTHAAVAERADMEAETYGYGYRWRAWGPTSVNLRQLQPGTVVIDLVDAESRELVWRGIATDTLLSKAKKVEKSGKQVAKAAEKLFEDFPPAP